ncbi:MAG: helix-turn-helix transcriptional regulator [Blautia sp.]|nr:helix-turn-helix transcriptional regulator [Blautia sp.]
MSDRLLFTNDFNRYPELPLALEGMGLYHPQEPVIRDPGLPIYQWVQTIEGCGQIAINGRNLLIPEKHGVFIPSSVSHEYADTSSGWVTNFLCFNGTLAQQLLKTCGFSDPEVYYIESPQFLLEKEQQIYELSIGKSPYKAYEISKILYDLIIELSLHASRKTILTNEDANHKALRAVRYIEKHFAEALQLSDLSDHVGLTKEYFCTLFKSEIGVSAFEYLQTTRLAQAKTLLINHPEKTVAEIAALSGFSSSSYFCSVFKKAEHMTPKDFRVKRR